MLQRLRAALGRNRSRPPHDGGRERVVVTGAAGLIGGILADGLRDEFDLHGIDVRDGPNVGAVVDTRELGAIEAAFAGANAVIDLAAIPSATAPWDEIRDNNLAATISVLEAARRAGIRRVVFASSNHVTGMYERDEPYASVVAGRLDGLDVATLPRLTVDVPIRPDGPYGISKAFGEVAGRYYADAYGLSVICLRIGTVNAASRPSHERHYSTLLTHRDLVDLVRCSLRAPASLGFGVFYGVSANTWRFWDIEDARAALGYDPRDDAESWRVSARR